MQCKSLAVFAKPKTVMGKFTNNVPALKCRRTNGKFALLLFSSILIFTSCGNSLSRSKAEQLIKDFYKPPVIQAYDYNYYDHKIEENEKNKLVELQEKGLVTLNYGFELTEAGKKYVYSWKLNGFLNTVNRFITNSYIFNEVSGIVVNEQNKTAMVNWTGKMVGITPFGELLGFKTNDLTYFSTKFVLYDDGWRIEDSNYKNIPVANYPFFNKKGEYIGTN